MRPVHQSRRTHALTWSKTQTRRAASTWPAREALSASLGLATAIGLSACSGCSASQLEETSSAPQREARATPADKAAPPAAKEETAAPRPRPALTDVAWITPRIKEARDRAQQRMLGEQAPLLPDLPPLPAGGAQAAMIAAEQAPLIPGFFVRVEDPEEQTNALAAFHDALLALEDGRDPDGKVRVVFFGASGTASDLWTGYVRTYLQTRFGDGGPGVVPGAAPNKWFHHSELSVVSSAGWTRYHAGQREKLPDQAYGLMALAMITTRAGEWARIGPSKSRADNLRVARYEIDYLEQPGGGRFAVSIDGVQVAEVATDAAFLGLGTFKYDVPPGLHRLEIVTLDEGAEVRLFDVVAESDTPGVVLDTVGIEGARASVHLHNDEQLFMQALARRAPDLIVLAYGTNEATDTDEAISAYESKERSVVLRMRRAAPQASCLLFGPGDFPLVQGKGKRRTIEPRPRVGEILEVQRRVAREMGCAFWDGREFMGGEGSMKAWVEAQPSFAQGDFLHFTRRGYVRLGQALSDALLLEYDLAHAADELGTK